MFVNQFRWGNLQDPRTAVDPESAGYAGTIRYQYALLAKALNFEGRQDSAVRVLDRCIEFFPDRKVPFDGIMVYLMEEYLKAGAIDKGIALAGRIEEIYMQRLDYVDGFPSRFARSVQYERMECLGVLYETARRLAPHTEIPSVNNLVNNLHQTLASYGIQ